MARRGRLPWLLALPLVVAGSLAAHMVGYLVTPAVAVGHGAGEVAEQHERSSEGLAGHSVLWLGLLAALAVVLAARAVLSRGRGRAARGVGPGWFFALPLLAFGFQELIERALGAEGFPFQAALEPRFLVGLSAQLPFALAAFLLGRVLLRAGRKLLARFARSPLPRPIAPTADPPEPQTRTLPAARALSRGHPLRGPPLVPGVGRAPLCPFGAAL